MGWAKGELAGLVQPQRLKKPTDPIYAHGRSLPRTEGQQMPTLKRASTWVALAKLLLPHHYF